MPRLSKKFLDEQGNRVWSDQDISDNRKAQRRTYYEKNKSKILQYAKDRRASKRATKVAVPKVKTAKKRTTKQSQYNQYVKENFKLVKAENPNMKSSTVLTNVARMWTALKKVYLKKKS